VELTITTLVLIGAIEFWHLLATSFVGAIIQSAVMPTRQAVVPLLVPQHLVMNAVSLQMGTMNLTRIFGPAIGGILIGPFGIGTAYAVCTGFFLMSVITTLPLPRHGMRQDRKGRRGSFVDDLLGGMRFVAQRPLFRMLIAVALLMPLFAFPLQHLLPVFQADVFERGPWALGVLMAATGVGGLAGTLFSASSDHLPRKGLLMFGGGLAMTAGYIAFALTPSFWVALVILALASVGRMLIQVMNHTVVQVLVPDEYRGRVMSLLMMSIGTAPLGILPVALAVDAFGARAAIAVHACLGLLVVLALFGLSSRLRGLNISALAQTELSPAQASKLVEDGSITQEEADRLTGRTSDRGAVEVEDVEGAPAEPAPARPRSGAPAPVDGGS
jgi:MFS transporter, DHA1 family, staphyloferrin A biosynthesis exporter